MPVARQDEPAIVATKTGVELKVLEPHEVKAGAVIEHTQAADLEEGPRDVDPNGERVFIWYKRGEYYFETTPLGAPLDEVAAALVKAQQEVHEAVQQACLSVERAPQTPQMIQCGC